MKFATDSSIVVKLYVLDEHSEQIEEFLWEDRKTLTISELARTEVINVLCREDGPVDRFLRDLESGTRIRLESLDWKQVFQYAESLARRFSRLLHPGSHDLVIVAASVVMGAATFLSFDKKSRQRALAAAAGLKVWPPLDKEEKGLVFKARGNLSR